MTAGLPSVQTASDTQTAYTQTGYHSASACMLRQQDCRLDEKLQAVKNFLHGTTAWHYCMAPLTLICTSQHCNEH